MTTAGSESTVPRIRFTAILAGGAIGLLLGAGYVGLLTSSGTVATGLRTGVQAVTAGAVVLFAVGFGVTLPTLTWTRRRFGSERRSLLTAASATFVALVIAAVLIDVVSGSRGLAAQIVLVAGLVCAVPACVLARPFTRHPRSAVAVLSITGLLAVTGAATIALF